MDTVASVAIFCGRFKGRVHVDGDSMVVNGDRIRFVAQRDPSELPWGELGVDVVLAHSDAPPTKVIEGNLVKVCAWVKAA
jgi:glyceraldehyde-3-phosphate dehydrogenase/erythrose-4-phosphate dehydrogenase